MTTTHRMAQLVRGHRGRVGVAVLLPAPSTVIRFLADEAVLLDEQRFTLYRLNGASAELLSQALRCGTWPRLEAELRCSGSGVTDEEVDKARSFVTSLCRAGLLTGSAARTLLEHDGAHP